MIVNGMWDTDEAAAQSGRDVKTIRWYISTGQLMPDGSYGRRHLFKPETITAFFAGRKPGKPKRKDMRRKENKT